MQVVAELVNGASGATTWQQTFDADLTDVFAVQSAIATRVATALGAELGTKETEDLAKRPTRNAAAWDAYLRATAITGNDPAMLRQRVANAEQAVALDSNFTEAWAVLSMADAQLYANASRDPGALGRALEAARRAMALAPENAAGHVAAGYYYTIATPDTTLSSRYFDTAVRLAPNDPEVLRRAAAADLSLGNVARAIPRLEKVRDLDPRSGAVLSNLADAYTRTGRTADGIEAAEAALTLAPGDLSSYEVLSIARASAGDLAGARDASRRGVAALSPPAIAGYYAGFNEMSWVLDSATQALVYRLTPTAFDGDRAWWGQALATANWLRGRKDLARAYADSALALSRAQAEAVSTDPAPRMLYALMLAYLGRGDEAIAEGRQALAAPGTVSGNLPSYNHLQMVRILIVLNRPDQAMDELESLLKKPTYVSRKWLTIDPLFTPLKGNPRFEKLVNGA